MPVAVGLVGFGYAGRTLHTPLILASGMRIAAVVSQHTAAVQAVLPGARVVTDIAALLALDELDLIVVATPNDGHESQALAALAAGKHVLVDKPLALSVPGVDRIAQLAEQRGRILAVFHNRRWDADFLTIRQLLQRQALGTLHCFESRWNRFRPDWVDRWRERPAQGGGVLLDLGTHLIDQALTLFGMPEWLQADVYSVRPGARVDDAFEIRMGQGLLRITLSAHCLIADPGPRFRLHGSTGSFTKYGLDPQEQQLRDGMSPSNPDFGYDAAPRGANSCRVPPDRSLPCQRCPVDG